MNENNLTNSEYPEGVNIAGAFALISIVHPISAVPVTLKYSLSRYIFHFTWDALRLDSQVFLQPLWLCLISCT